MEPGSYSLLQIEAPNVNADEIKSALRWKVKDLIDFHVDDATIDLFEMPGAGRDGAAKMMNVIVARTTWIQQHINKLHAADIEPHAIDITELALRNIAQTCLEQDSDPCAAVYILPENIYIEVIDNTTLYLNRNIETHFQQQADDANSSAFLDTSSHELLSLEMQRSMDYYESHYGNGPAFELRVFQKLDDNDDFIRLANEQLPFKVNSVSLSDYIQGIEHIDNHLLPDYLPAIGAALRAA